MDHRAKVVEVAVLTLLALQFFVTSHRADAGNPLAPLLQPLFGNMCNGSAQCGRGTCEESSDIFFGYVCNCEPGWRQFTWGDTFRFLPCVVPNCTVNYKCLNDSGTPAPPPEPSSNTNISNNICSVAYCGGGHCVRNSTVGYHCECYEGYSNLLNSTNLPCYRDCSLGADCSDLGISLNNSSSPPPSLSDNGGNPSGGGNSRFAHNSFLWIGSILGISVMSLVG